MHLKILFILITCYQLTEGKPYVNTRRLSFGEQMTWRFGGWKPMVTSSSSGLRSEDHLSGLGSLISPSVNNNSNSLNNVNSNSNFLNSNVNLPLTTISSSSSNNHFYNNHTSANGGVKPSGLRNNGTTSLSINGGNNHLLRVNPINGLSSTPSSSLPSTPSSSSSSPSLTPLLPISTSALVSPSSSSSSPSEPASGSGPESSESHLNPKYRHIGDMEQVKIDDYLGGFGGGKGYPGSPGPFSTAVHGFYGPSMGHSFGKSTYGFPGLKGGRGGGGGQSSFLLPPPGHLSYLGRGLPHSGIHLGPRPNRHEGGGGQPPHGKPVKDAELHAYRVIKQLKERGRDIRKDFGIVDAFPVNRGLYPKVTTGEGGKRYVTVPVAIETDHDKVLTQNDIKDIEKEVLKIIPEVEHGLVEGAVKDGARVIELAGGNGAEKGGRSIGRPPITVTSPSAAGGGGGGGGHHIPGHSSGGVITGPSPIIYDNLAANPIKSRISSIFRPLLSKFRSPNRPHQSHPQPYSTSDPKNLNVIHLIAHQDRLPSVVPIDRLVQRPDGSSGQGNTNNQRYPGMGHGQQQQQQPPMANLQYKIIHPPQGQQQQQQQHQQSFIEYNPHQGSPQQPPSGQVNGGGHPQQQSPPYQVIEVPRGYDVSPDHLLESPPQVVPINGEQLVDLKANQYNSGDEPHQPNHQQQQHQHQHQPNHQQIQYHHQHHQGPSSYGLTDDQGPTPGSVEIVNRPTESGVYPEPPSSVYPTTGSPNGGSNYDSTNYDDGENGKHQVNNNYDSNNHHHGSQSDYNNHQQQSNQQHPGNYGNDYSVTDYPNPVGPEYNLNGHSGQIERPGKDYPSEGNLNGGSEETVDQDGDQNNQGGSTLTPSVDYAESPKIELLNGASPDFNGKPYTTPSELDTKMLINLISNQIPSLGNVLKGGESESNGKGGEEGDRSRSVDNGQQINYQGQGNQEEGGYNGGQHQGISSPPPVYDDNKEVGDSPQGDNYGGRNEGDGGNGSNGGGDGGNGYPQRENTFTESAVNQDQSLRFGDRIRGQEVIYAKAEHYDDQHYQTNSQSSSGLYSESSNSQEVRVKSDNSTKKEATSHTTTDHTDDGETFTFVKLDRRDKPINGKVIFGQRSKLNGSSTDNLATPQSYHAYYESSDHIPPPGYVKLTVKEFKELFKDADIHYSKDDQSDEQLTSSASQLNHSTTTTSSSSKLIKDQQSSSNESTSAAVDDGDDTVSNIDHDDEVTTIKSPSEQSNDQHSKVESIVKQ